MIVSLNDAANWRAFDRNDITHSAAHYLMAIDALRDRFGYARVTDVAQMLEVSRGAASMAIAQLKKRGWVGEDPNRFLLLTDDGVRMAHLVEDNFRLLSSFFEKALGVPPETALADACKMEHLMSLETGRRILCLMRTILSDPAHIEELRQAIQALDDGEKATNE